jgi:hypothetical protein
MPDANAETTPLQDFEVLLVGMLDYARTGSLNLETKLRADIKSMVAKMDTAYGKASLTTSSTSSAAMSTSGTETTVTSGGVENTSSGSATHS